MKIKLKQMNRNVCLHGTDSGKECKMKYYWLSGGTLSLIWGEWTNLIIPESKYKDEKGV